MMKSALIISFQLIAITALCLSTKAATLYVEITGSDTNSGSITHPFQTIGQALSMAGTGDTVQVGSGEFREFLEITKPITLSGQNTYSSANPPLHRHNSFTSIRAPSANTEAALINISATNVFIKNISIYGDAAGDGVPSVKAGIYTEYRPVTVFNCRIANFTGQGIRCAGNIPSPQPADTDSLRSYLQYNLISNISHSTSFSNGIYLERTQATIEFNEISRIRSFQPHAAIFLSLCSYTANMTSPVLIRNNYLNDCDLAMWANDPISSGETLEIRGNTITNSLIGIRLTAARGRAAISSNHIHVLGVSSTTNQTPARGIWIHADQDPWNAPSTTDHQIIRNTLISQAVTNDGTIGMLFAYDTTTWNNKNNGLRATVLTNYVYNFAIGSKIVSGTNGVSISNDPLVEVVYHFNDIYNSVHGIILTTGFTYMVDATTNFLGYTNPGPLCSTNVTYTGWTLGSLTLDTDGDGWLDYVDNDDDGDGIDDLTEIAIGTSPVKADTDGDGMNDYDEYYIAGTDPLDPASVLDIGNFDRPAPDIVKFEWPSVTGRTYYVYRITNLIEGFTVPITNYPASPPTNYFTDNSATGIIYFYQISVTTNN